MTIPRLLDGDCSDELRTLLHAAPPVPPIPRDVDKRLERYALGLAAGVTSSVALGAGTAHATQMGVGGKLLSALASASLAVKVSIVVTGVMAAGTLGYVGAGAMIAERDGNGSAAHAVRRGKLAVEEVPKQEHVDEPSQQAHPGEERVDTEPFNEVSAEGNDESRRSALPVRMSGKASHAGSRDASGAVASDAASHVNESERVSSLSQEARMLELARGALATRPEEALQIAGEHINRFPKGQLSAERELIAIDALLRLGQRRAAERRAAALLAGNASLLYGKRVRQLLEPGSSEK